MIAQGVFNLFVGGNIGAEHKTQGLACALVAHGFNLVNVETAVFVFGFKF